MYSKLYALSSAFCIFNKSCLKIIFSLYYWVGGAVWCDCLWKQEIGERRAVEIFSHFSLARPTEIRYKKTVTRYQIGGRSVGRQHK